MALSRAWHAPEGEGKKIRSARSARPPELAEGSWDHRCMTEDSRNEEPDGLDEIHELTDEELIAIELSAVELGYD